MKINLKKLTSRDYSTLGNSHQGVKISTIFELVNYGLIDFLIKQITKGGGQDGIMERRLISSFEEVELYDLSLLGEKSGELTMKVLNLENRETLTGTLLMPFYFELKVQGEIVAKGRCVAATYA